MPPLTEQNAGEIYERIRKNDEHDANQDTKIAVIESSLEQYMKNISDSLDKITEGKSVACLQHTADIAALKLAITQESLTRLETEKALSIRIDHKGSLRSLDSDSACFRVITIVWQFFH